MPSGASCRRSSTATTRARGSKALAKRAVYLARGLLYAASGVIALALVVGAGLRRHERAGGDGESARPARADGGSSAPSASRSSARGAFNLYRSLTSKFRKHLREHEMCGTERGWTIAVGVAGHAARGSSSA